MKTLLIAVSSGPLAETLANDLAEKYRIIVSDEGTQALALLLKVRPELMILDLMLPGMDGITLLRTAENAGVNPTVLAVTGYLSDYLLCTLEKLHVGYVMRLPCNPPQLVARVLELDRFQTGDFEQTTTYEDTLAALGFRLTSVGCRMILKALACLREEPTQKITLDLYPRVASMCNTTPAQVERAIRTAISAAWKCCDPTLWAKYFAIGANGKVIKPTNGEFLTRLILRSDKTAPKQNRAV